MKMPLVYLLIGFTIIISSCTKQDAVKVKEIKVKAPFDMPAIKTPDFSDCKKYPITDYGAVQGDKEKTSRAIAEAITAANQAGGGIVVIPEGEWLIKKIHLKSNVNLHLNKNALLLFSEKPEDYLPPLKTTWEGMECYNYSPLIYAYQCRNIAITGEGTLKAKMDVWYEWFSRPPAHMNSLKRLYHLAAKNKPVKERVMVNDSSHLRPQFIQFNRCENVLLEGISIRRSPFWVIHPFLSKHVVIRNVNVYAHGHNNDGVDPEMSQNVLIEDCVFDQGDDGIAVKSGRNQDAWRLNTPSKNIVVRNCLMKNAHQLLAIGSELSGGVENIFMDSCTVADGVRLFNLVYIKTNERRGGFVRNIHVSNIHSGRIDQGIFGVETDVLYQWRDLVPTYERRLTPIHDIYLKNIQAANVDFISKIMAQEEQPVKNVFFTNVFADTIRGEKKMIHENVKNFNFE